MFAEQLVFAGFNVHGKHAAVLTRANTVFPSAQRR
jgi:hypothetical protein